MERPTRRSATTAGANGMNSASHSSGHSSHSNGSNNSSSRRRRREVGHDIGEGEGGGGGGGGASASDGAETDSSSVAVEMGTTRSTKTSSKKGKSSTQRTANDSDHVNGSHSANGLAKALRDAAADGQPDMEEEDDQDDQQEAEEEEEEEEEEEAPTGYATRARRERSQSVVSTTSDTSSIASEHPEEHLRPELHDEKLQELEKKKQMVEEGTLAEYCRRVAEFKEERNRLLQTAEWHKNLQLKNTQDLYGFEVQRAHNIWQDTKDKLKDSMLAKADALLLQLKQEMEILNKATQLPIHVVATKKTLILPPAKSTSAIAGEPASPENLDEPEPSSSPDGVDAAQTLPPSSKRRKMSAPVPDNVLRLPLDDITSDLASIVQARDSASATLHAALPAPRLEVRVDRRRLLCGKYVFEEGDEVVVTTVVLKEDYIGVVSSVSDVELYVKLSTGQKVRVAVDHIALRRCEIRPFLRGSAGIESLQSSGWVECEPF